MNTKRDFSTGDLARIALMAALIALCSWISVPWTVPFTLQTFGVFCAVGLLGGRNGSIAVALYILMGAVGLPVFSGFTGGLDRLLGVTGGYIVGFFFSALAYWLVIQLLGRSVWALTLGMLLGLAVCYAFGTVWFVLVYTRSVSPIGFGAALAKCVLPFIIPDLIKIGLALSVTRALEPHLRRKA